MDSLDGNWRWYAACLGKTWMTEPGNTAAAVRVCRGCRVYDQCLQWVQDTRPEVAGVVAGLSVRQRGLHECVECGVITKWVSGRKCWSCQQKRA